MHIVGYHIGTMFSLPDGLKLNVICNQGEGNCVAEPSRTHGLLDSPIHIPQPTLHVLHPWTSWINKRNLFFLCLNALLFEVQAANMSYLIKG